MRIGHWIFGFLPTVRGAYETWIALVPNAEIAAKTAQSTCAAHTRGTDMASVRYIVNRVPAALARQVAIPSRAGGADS